MSVLERPAPTSSPAAPRHTAERPSVWTSPRLWVVGAFVLIAAVQLVNLNGWPAMIDDEGTYTAQAWAVLHGEMAHYQYWYDHPPAGWIQLALFLGIPSLLGIEPSVEVARYVMVGYTLVAALLLHRLVRNLGGRQVTAVAAMLLWGLSPLVLAQGRQVTLDTLTLPWVIGALVLATGRSRSLWQHVAAGACIGMAVLTKETAALAVPAVAVAVWGHAFRPTRAFSAVGATVMAVLVGGIYPLFALLKSEVFAGADRVSIQDAIAFQLLDRPGSGTIFDATSGSRQLISGWLFYDQVVLGAGVVAGVLCLFHRQWRSIGVLTVVMVAMVLRPGGYLPSMYIIGLLPFLTVAAVLVAQAVLTRVARVRVDHRPVGAVVAAALVAVMAVYVASGWVSKIDTALTRTDNDNRAASLSWMDDNLDRDDRILVDDSYWNDLVNDGWSGDGWAGPIWYYKLDLDPVAQQANLPDGWKQVDYVVVSRHMRTALVAETVPPQLEAAYDNSTVVREWGTGADAVELRRVVSTGLNEPTEVTTS